jgi:hypothetical protein
LWPDADPLLILVRPNARHSPFLCLREQTARPQRTIARAIAAGEPR